MDEGLYTRIPSTDKGTTPEGVQTGRLKTYGRKLKNKTSASKYYGEKLRTGKADNKATAEEAAKSRKLHKQGKKKSAELERIRKSEAGRTVSKSSAISSDASNVATLVSYAGQLTGSSSEEKEESAVAEEVFDTGGYIASGAVSSATAKVRNKKYSNKVHGKRHLSGTTEDAAKLRARKEMQKKASRTQAKAAENSGKIGRKITDKAEDLITLLAETITEFVKDNPVIAAIIAVVLLLILVIMGMFNSCAALGSGGQSVTVITTFTAKDEDILHVEDDYKDLEEDLQGEVADIESDYPGYDEYNFYLDEVGHNPYQLAAILTVIFEDYRRGEVQAKLQEIFDLQYELTIEEVEETREREVEKTGTRWVEDDSYPEGGYEEEYTYTETEEYQYYILNVYLVNHTLEEVVNELGFTEDELARYEVLLETFGNKKYLFGEDDIYNIPGRGEGDFDDYRVPGEYLTDEEFARMLREAERYLGTPYVWGGYDPDGFDCSGFVSYVINHCGNGWNVGRQTANGLRGITGYVPASEAKPGDLVFFQGTYDTAGCSHVGIYVGNGMMIHAGNPIHYSSINTPYWQNHFHSFGRIN
ncbi:C40 family peptidase [Butyrivibrio sp. INlla14]|uniref:C40 family peptidase n=1 Tax=Butyrivibrio sp. INlla14 TaxID=1520808 RepID=UPI000876DCBA|nr:C40 family peptidase [Butyrivibrio sp. INlla14]SCY13813.1 NlpC/P60 family protein [Butyrivibrio sp. INlla14]